MFLGPGASELWGPGRRGPRFGLDGPLLMTSSQPPALHLSLSGQRTWGEREKVDGRGS